MNQYLNTKRLLRLCRKDYYTTRRQIILAAATIGAFIFLIGLIGGKDRPVSPSSYNSYFTIILYLGGIITTAAIFKDRHDRDSIHNWLMLPASTLEKYLVRFLFSTVGLILITLITVWLSSFITSLALFLLYGHSFSLFNFTDKRDIWLIIQGYLALHPFFFLGAAWFRKNQIIKTLLTLFIIQIILSFIGGGLGYMFLIRFAMENEFYMTDQTFFNDIMISGKNIALMARILFQLIIPVCCWTTAYFKLKKAEVKDGI
ncbi:MAG: hypothetical protein B6241_04125 [Spirochaetaceae bacterium 4572_59]|nr:MAG: hypothetical protein B6241_04125 [Spirochaetaceae bacterium 4572_59]